jgi:DNA-binding CsgD family transcriptional regulator
MGADVRLGWGDDALPLGSHVCVLYTGTEVLSRVMAFMRTGLDLPHEFCSIFADRGQHERLLALLQQGYAGDVRSLLVRGKLALLPGAPTKADLLASLGRRFDQALAEGYRVIRLLGFVAWGEPGWPGDIELIEFEASVNEIIPAYPAVVLCAYRVGQIAWHTLVHAGLQAHPQVTLDAGAVRSSPLFTHPAELAEQVRRAFPSRLTRREVQVLLMVATGLSNAQVAANLHLSKRTVDAHLRSVYRKLDVRSRAAATRWAVERRMV